MITEKEVLRYLEDHFSGISSDYEGIRKRYENYVKTKNSQPLADEIAAYISADEKLLDIGSGWGSFVYLLRAKGYKAYGIEIQELMVDYARQRLDIIENPAFSSEVIYMKASALNLPFPDAHFEVITLWDVLEHIEDYEKTLTEAIRVLKPNGKLFIKNVNYAACFIEPHYRVPWVPFLPKEIAIRYLQLLGRNPSYIKDGIFYISNLAILKHLAKNHMHITSLQVEKLLSNSPTIKSPVKRFAYKVFVFFRIRVLLVLLLKFFQFNPFRFYIDIMAIKK